MEIDSKQSAFPIFLQNGLSHDSHVDAGVSIRTYIATKAMQGLLSGFPNYMPSESEIIPLSVKMADALIEELNKDK